ncbi:MAG: hypothetical protein IKP28_05715 [Clostridia bacterium]|nr:hypothetical protein [Clostridia bacterium]
MNKNIVIVLFLILIFLIATIALSGCENGDTTTEGGKIYPGDIMPPDDYKISTEDQTCADMLKKIGLDDDNIVLVIYNLKRANSGSVTKIEIDSSGKFYNIYDSNNNLFKLYISGKAADALLDRNGNSIFTFIK